VAIVARFSEAFHERFGHEIVGELVTWFNDMELTARQSLREFNELNFARFDAKLEQRLAELRSELRSEMHAMDVNLRSEIRAVDTSLRAVIQGIDTNLRAEIQAGDSALRTEMRTGFAELKMILAEQSVVQMRWMVGMWLTVLLAVMGLWLRR
jgi:hypothetical protein